MVLDEDETEDNDEVVSFQRIRRIIYVGQPDAQPKEIRRLLTEMEIVENAESRFQSPVVASD